MIKNKNMIRSIVYVGIIVVVSQLTTYGINYESAIQYVNEEDKAILQNLNTVDNNVLISSNNSATTKEVAMNDTVEKSIENVQVSDNVSYHPVTTVWMNTNATIYSEMNEESNTNEEISLGEKLQVELINDSWARVMSTNTFIKTENISYEKVARNLNLTRWVTDILNFRNEPSKESEVQEILTPGTIITVMDYEDDWSYISIDGKTGWVMTEYLSEEEVIPPLTSLGTFKITHYCNCSICCGKYAGQGTTATGAKLQEGVTIAVDPSVIPYGTQVVINGNTYTAQDCGGGVNGNHIDIYVSTHAQAREQGSYKTEVFKVNY